MAENKEKTRPLLIVYTGDGKGKTTAALGMCIRAVGYGWKICIIQFVKGSWKYGELKGIRRLEPDVELHTVGEGFVGIIDDDKTFQEHRRAAGKGVELAVDKISSGQYQLVILDELNVAVNLGLVDPQQLDAILAARGKRQHLVITGRNAPDALVAQADLVTEMREVKHPFKQGILAQKGIDW
ncbi:MAG: cob(I)yrinic acid a,c-diamide adenosyltransferase [Candidatus Zixiibacteriota bacterium]|nr:MAG: cob(I)yrinic acid a,c-diamide adenosyltransferase [candidate division Zixibacteria bacterium]